MSSMSEYPQPDIYAGKSMLERYHIARENLDNAQLVKLARELQQMTEINNSGNSANSSSRLVLNPTLEDLYTKILQDLQGS